jgi:hypothetical protein
VVAGAAVVVVVAAVVVVVAAVVVVVGTCGTLAAVEATGVALFEEQAAMSATPRSRAVRENA